MSLRGRLSSLFGRKAKQLTYDQIADRIDGQSSIGAITPETALGVSTVLACAKAIADGCATPRLGVYRENGAKRRELARNIPEYRLLAARPNEWQTSFEWRRMMTIHAVLADGGLSLKVRGNNRRVQELIPVPPGRWFMRKTARYEVEYHVYDEFGLIGVFGQDDVFVLNGLQWDWARKIEAVQLVSNSIRLAMASEHSQTSFHDNGIRTSGVYSVDGTLNEQQHERLSKQLEKYRGQTNAGIPIVLDRNAKFQSVMQTGVDAQHVETRRLQVEEICRGFGVFPIMIGHSDKTATFASSEAFFAAHVKHTLAPWHTNWNQRLDEFLLDGAGPLWTEFDVRYLLQGSMSDRSVWARTMAELGIYTRNELRDEEGLDPLPGLDEPLTPANMNGNQAKPPADPSLPAGG